VDVTAPPKPRRGRPLEADRTPAILDAVLDLLHDGGYDRLRVQDVAERAGVGLGTIYRRWPTKQALVIDALQCERALDEKFVDTGDPVADLEATFLKMATMMAEHGDIVGFIASMRTEPEVAEIFRCTSLAALRDRVRSLLAAARHTEVDDPSLDLLTDVGPAVILFRVALANEVGDLERLAHDVTRMLLDHPATA
jgi:AcrR family transcriptional regulator